MLLYFSITFFYLAPLVTKIKIQNPSFEFRKVQPRYSSEINSYLKEKSV